MGILGFLLKIARAVVQGIINQIKGQVNMIMNAVTQPLNMIIQSVVAGAWKGDGADRFVAEMQSEVMQALQNMTGGLTNTGTLINKALDTMWRADRSARTIASGLLDDFKNIGAGL